MSPDQQVRGKIIAITGAARGIGLASAKALAAAGAWVAIGDLDLELAERAAASVGGDTIGLALDVTDGSSFERFLDETEARLGPIDVLVNNAGIMPLGAFLDEPDTVTRRIVEVNLHGVITGMKLAAPRFVARGHGQIINVASAVGRVALAHAATYSATKYALIGLTQATRSELRSSGVEVCVIVPMIVNTDLGAGLSKVRGQRTVAATEVADAIVATVRKPRFETWVPRSGQRLYRLMSLLPEGWSSALSRAVGAADVLATADPAARSGYENSVRR
jgi:NAD(P)-dependent dehydrogenase (short-subunit alcohol dehydrogenase family)